MATLCQEIDLNIALKRKQGVAPSMQTCRLFDLEYRSGNFTTENACV